MEFLTKLEERDWPRADVVISFEQSPMLDLEKCHGNNESINTVRQKQMRNY